MTTFRIVVHRYPSSIHDTFGATLHQFEPVPVSISLAFSRTGLKRNGQVLLRSFKFVEAL